MDGVGASDGAPGSGPPRPEASGPVVVDSPTRSRLSAGDAIRAHLTLAIGLVVCVVAFWFEIGRALDGNGLSWAYVFEWPLFALFAVYMWWNVLHGDRSGRRRKGMKVERPVDPRYAGMLEAWQAHQRELRSSQAEADADTDATRRRGGIGESPGGGGPGLR
jgi:hypothetical protein